MKKILVPSDLSSISEKALTLAAKIATKHKSHIHLVNFTKHPFGKTFTATGEIDKKYPDEENLFTVQLVRKNNADLQKMAAQYDQNGYEINYGVYDEDFDEGVEAYIRENGIDLVVMGTTGEENVKEYFTGNHTQQVIELAPCPVLSVREGDDTMHLNKIVLGIDFKKDHDDNFLKSIAYLNDFASGLAAKISLVHVSENNDHNERELNEFGQKYGLQNYEVSMINNSDPKQGLLAYAHKNGAGIVAVLTHADGGFFRAFDESLSEEMNKQSDLPVLTINLHKV